jgi:FKBP-type peptidyl-prolyl cis-trans isomerase FklB
MAEDLKTESDQASYIIGRSMVQQLKKSQADINYKALQLGVSEEISAAPEKFKKDEVQKIMISFEATARKKQEQARLEAADKNEKEGRTFLAENGKKKDVVTTSSGLQYKIITPGNGTSPKTEDSVKVNYEGRLINGEVFDSSYERGQPVTFGVGQVIKGWTEALTLMKPGAKWELYIPADLAYGKQGTPGPIGPNATLLFTVELLEVVKKEASTATANKPAS